DLFGPSILISGDKVIHQYSRRNKVDMIIAGDDNRVDIPYLFYIGHGPCIVDEHYAACTYMLRKMKRLHCSRIRQIKRYMLIIRMLDSMATGYACNMVIPVLQ